MRYFLIPALALIASGCAAPGKPAPAERNGSARPQVTGSWIGTWGVAGAPAEKRQALDCRVVALNADTWEATFEGDCGRPYKYTIKMLGRQAADVVLFKGSVDLGPKDGGMYDGVGKATETTFVGVYTRPKYTGSFELSRR